MPLNVFKACSPVATVHWICPVANADARFGDAVTRVQNAELQQEAAFARLKAAQTDYNKALESGNQAEIERTKIALQTAQSSSVSADEEYLNATSEMKALAGEVKSASRDTVDGLNMVSNGLHGFASGTLQGSLKESRTCLPVFQN